MRDPKLGGGRSDDQDFLPIWPKLGCYGQNGQAKFDHDNLCNSKFFVVEIFRIVEISVDLLILTIWW